MIAWLNPAAFTALLAVAGPIAIHLLRRQRARRQPFPSLRFVPASRTAAVRLRLPADPWLLALRAAILTAAALAFAQPLLVTAERREAWSARVARAIVVDTSASMATVGSAVREAASAEEQGTDQVVRIDAVNLRAGIAQATASLEGLPPARREIVVISDFQRGAISAADLAAVPASVGLRFVPVGRPRGDDEFTGDTLFASGGTSALTQTIALRGGATSAALRASTAIAEGLRLVAPPNGAAAEPWLRAVARSGAPAPSPREPIAVVFEGAALPAASGALTSPWMIRTIVRLRRDPEVSAAAAEMEAPATSGFPQSEPLMPLVFDRNGRSVVFAAAAGRELVIAVRARPETYLAAAAIKGVLDSRRGPAEWPERETERVSREELDGWSRAPGDVPGDRWRTATPGDARWLWASALALLITETLVRRRRTHAAARELEAHAA